MTEQERFEKWAEHEGYQIRKLPSVVPCYYSDFTNSAWITWQAAIESKAEQKQTAIARPGIGYLRASKRFNAIMYRLAILELADQIKAIGGRG